MTITNDSAARKATPLWSGLLRYFPNACCAVARLSKKANEKHNPGEPMHWAREKSTDHQDCIVRHMLDPEAIDPETGETHACAVAWRALAQLELIEEKRLYEESLLYRVRKALCENEAKNTGIPIVVTDVGWASSNRA